MLISDKEHSLILINYNQVICSERGSTRGELTYQALKQITKEEEEAQALYKDRIGTLIDLKILLVHSDDDRIFVR